MKVDIVSIILILRPNPKFKEKHEKRVKVCGERRAATKIRSEPVRHCSTLWKFHILIFIGPSDGRGSLIPSHHLELGGEKFGSEARTELMEKYEQNHPLIFHIFPISRLIVSFH